jgi:hypothetical protein
MFKNNDLLKLLSKLKKVKSISIDLDQEYCYWRVVNLSLLKIYTKTT